MQIILLRKIILKIKIKGSFKIWFSALSSLILVVLFSAKFLNNYEFKNKADIENKKLRERNYF